VPAGLVVYFVGRMIWRTAKKRNQPAEPVLGA
jgi:hypothetical protein